MWRPGAGMPAMHPLPHHLPQVVSWDSSYVLGISGNHTGFGIRLPAFSLSCAAKSLQSCLTLCDPLDGSPPGSAVPGILQARILEWAAISFSNAWKWKVKVKLFSHVRLFVIPWTAAHQAPQSTGVGCHCLLLLAHMDNPFPLFWTWVFLT